MYDNSLMDVLSAKGKAAGGYCTEILEYKSPFIFSNFNGTSGDVDVLTHEAGHAFAYYSVRDKMELCDQISPTMESCEVHSMSMEFFAWPWHELFYGSDAVRSRFVHLESALVFLPYGTMVDEFQHIVYDSPELTPAERNKSGSHSSESTARIWTSAMSISIQTDAVGRDSCTSISIRSIISTTASRRLRRSNSGR